MPYGGDPSASTLDAVRFMVGDTDTSEELLSDGEINYLIAQWGTNVTVVAAHAALALSLKFAREADKSVDRASESASQRSAAYKALYSTLLNAASANVLPSIGGRSKSEKQSLEENTDGVQPEVRKSQFDYPGRSGL